MYLELNPVLLVLTALLIALLALAFVRWVGARGWLVVLALLLVAALTNPDKDAHAKFARQQAGIGPAGAVSAAGTAELAIRSRSGPFAPLADYRDLGIASVIVVQGKIVSFGVLGQVWAVKRQRIASRPRRGPGDQPSSSGGPT